MTAFILVACDNKEILQGKRESIAGVTEISQIGAPGIKSSEKITLQDATSLSEYLDVAGNKQHISINHKMKQDTKRLWKVSLKGSAINSDPIAFGGNVYVVNSNGDLLAISQNDGKKLWSIRIAPQPDTATFSGGITSDGTRIYAATNIGDVVTVDSKTQKIVWKKSLKYPLRGAPLYTNGKLIVNTIDGQTFALNSANGNIIWTKTSPSEMTIMASAGTPALYGNDIICAYSSGDLKSLNIQSGSDNWDEILSSANLSHIAASPIVSNGKVLAATPEAKMVMFDAASGIQIWEKEVGTMTTPVINSGWIFVLTGDRSVICLSEKDGSTKWIVAIKDLYGDKFSKDLEFVGPILINGDIAIFSNNGDIFKLDVSTGKLKKTEKISNMSTNRTPIIVDGKLFAVTSRADLYAIG